MTYGFKFINGTNELVLDDGSVKPWYVKDPNTDPNTTIRYGLNYKNVNITDEYNWGSFGQPKINGVDDTWVVFALHYLAPNNCVSVGMYTLPSSDSTGIWYATAGVEPIYYLQNSRTPGPMVIPSYLGGDWEYIPSVGAPYPYFIIHAAVPTSWLSTATTEQINAAIPKVYFFGITEIPKDDLNVNLLTNANKYGVRLYNDRTIPQSYPSSNCTYDSNKSHIKLENYSFPYIQTPNPPGTFGPDYNGLTVISNVLGMPANANNAVFQIPNILQRSLTTTSSGSQSITIYKTFFKRTQTSKISSVNFAVTTVNNILAPGLSEGTVYLNTGSEIIDSTFAIGFSYYKARLLVLDSAYLDLGYTPIGLPATYSLAVYSGDNTGIVSEEINIYYAGDTPNPRMRFVLNTSGVANGTLVPYTLSGTGFTVSDILYIDRTEAGTSVTVASSLTGSFYVYNGVAEVDVLFADDNIIEGTETITMTLNNGQGNASMQVRERQSFRLSYTADKLPYTQYSDDYQEGTTITVTLKSANIPNGTQLPYTISGTNITSSDINNAPLSGYFTVNTGGGSTSHGIATITIVLTSDNIVETTETLTLTIAGANYYIPVNTVTFKIIDPAITYAIYGPNGEASGPYTAINVNEGSTYTFSIQTTGIANGTQVYPRFDSPNTATWADIDASWFNKTTSTYTGVTINNGTANFSFTVINDYLTEGTEYFNIYLDSAPGGPQVVSWGRIVLQDTSITKDEVLTITPSSVQYPNTVTVQVTGGVPNTNVYFHADAVATTADLYITLDANGSYINDHAFPSIAVGSHTLYLLFEATGHSRSAYWTVTAAPPTYAIAANVSSVNEGGTITYTVTTTNVANGTVLYWINYGTTSPADVTSNSNTGSVTIYGNTASFTRTLVNDQTTEGSETDYIFLYSDAAYATWTGAYTAQVTVNDTSTTPVVKTYSISSNVTSVNEGGTITYTVTTTNVLNNTYLYWINYGSTAAADFTSNSNSGSVLIYNNTGTFTRTLVNDQTTEGSETDYIFLYTDSEYSNFAAYTAQVTVNDTSTTAVTYNESNYISGASTVTYPSGVDMYWSGGYPNGTVYYELNALATTSSATFGLSPTGTGHNPTAGAYLAAGNYTLYCLYAETGHRTSLSFTILAAAPVYPGAGTTNGGQYCSGYTLYQNYNDGSGGTYASVVANNSPTCGYVAPSGPTTQFYSSATNDSTNTSIAASPSMSSDYLMCFGSGRNSIDMYVERTFYLTQAATITGYLIVSSESGYDFGYLYLDGVQYATGSGNYNSGALTGGISAGWHTVKCRYTKDGSASAGSDYAYVTYSIS